MRPAGEIRQALRTALEALSPEQRVGGVTYRDLGRTALVGFEEARKTVKEMARAGELRPVGARAEKGSRRSLTLYVPAANCERAYSSALHDLMNAWQQAA